MGKRFVLLALSTLAATNVAVASADEAFSSKEMRDAAKLYALQGCNEIAATEVGRCKDHGIDHFRRLDGHTGRVHTWWKYTTQGEPGTERVCQKGKFELDEDGEFNWLRQKPC